MQTPGISGCLPAKFEARGLEFLVRIGTGILQGLETEKRAGGALFLCWVWLPYATFCAFSFPTITRWAVEMRTSNVRIVGSVSARGFSISWILGNCSLW